uniref:Domain of unknown function DB domain-containing protein n=1 Tax=Panagrolaimus superbus TaxID=310955 RepID=A0A914YJE1_9BILA
MDPEYIIGALFNSDCGVKDGRAFYQCLHDNKNNRECCEKNDVSNPFEYCLDLCDGTIPIQLEMKYFNCKDAVAIVGCGQRPWM